MEVLIRISASWFEDKTFVDTVNFCWLPSNTNRSGNCPIIVCWCLPRLLMMLPLIQIKVTGQFLQCWEFKISLNIYIWSILSLGFLRWCYRLKIGSPVAGPKSWPAGCGVLNDRWRVGGGGVGLTAQWSKNIAHQVIFGSNCPLVSENRSAVFPQNFLGSGAQLSVSWNNEREK